MTTPSRAMPTSRKKTSGKTPAPPKPKKCKLCGRQTGHAKDCPNARCSECKTQAELGHLIGCSKNPSRGRRGLSPVATSARSTGATFKSDVDARPAIVNTRPAPTPPAAPKQAQPWPKQALLPGALEALELSIDDGDFSGDTQKQDRCELTITVNGEPEQCPHFAIVKKVVKNHCELCKRDRKETKLRLCVRCAINVWGGNAPANIQTEMDL